MQQAAATRGCRSWPGGRAAGGRRHRGHPDRWSALGPHGVGNGWSSAGTSGQTSRTSIAGQRPSTVTTSDGEEPGAGFEPLIPRAAAGLRPFPTRQSSPGMRLTLRPSSCIAARLRAGWSSPAVPPTCPSIGGHQRAQRINHSLSRFLATTSSADRLFPSVADPDWRLGLCGGSWVRLGWLHLVYGRPRVSAAIRRNGAAPQAPPTPARCRRR